MSFTLTLWSGGVDKQSGKHRMVYIITSVKEAGHETKHHCWLEKCIRTLVRLHIVPQTDERQAVKRPPDPVERLEIRPSS